MKLDVQISDDEAIFDELEHGKVVGEGAGGRDDLDEIGLEGFDPFGRLFQSLGARKVVEADEQRGPGFLDSRAELGELGVFCFFGRFHFKVDNGAAGFSGFEKDIEFGIQRANEVAAKLFAAAGGDGGQVAVPGEELLQTRKRGAGLGECVEAKLQELGIFGCLCGAGPHFLGGGGLDGDAQLAQPGPGKRRGGGKSNRIGISTRHGHQLTHLKREWSRMQQ